MKKYIEYKSKNIDETEVLTEINTYDIPSYIIDNPELFDDILWLLNNKELTYINPYKQMDNRTPNLIRAFKLFDIKLTGKENFIKMKDGLYIKIKLEIIE